VDCAVYASAAQEGVVGCVDDAVDFEFCDVMADDCDFEVVKGVVGVGWFFCGGERFDVFKFVEEGEGGDFIEGYERHGCEFVSALCICGYYYGLAVKNIRMQRKYLCSLCLCWLRALCCFPMSFWSLCPPHVRKG